MSRYEIDVETHSIVAEMPTATVLKGLKARARKVISKAKSTGPRGRVRWRYCEPDSPGGRPPWSFRPIRLGISTPDQLSSRAPDIELSVRSGVPPHHQLCRSAP